MKNVGTILWGGAAIFSLLLVVKFPPAFFLTLLLIGCAALAHSTRTEEEVW